VTLRNVEGLAQRSIGRSRVVARTNREHRLRTLIGRDPGMGKSCSVDLGPSGAPKVVGKITSSGVRIGPVEQRGAADKGSFRVGQEWPQEARAWREATCRKTNVAGCLTRRFQPRCEDDVLRSRRPGRCAWIWSSWSLRDGDSRRRRVAELRCWRCGGGRS
jgi:hypothetical protein